MNSEQLQELRRTVTLEAAMFFSMPCWMLTVDPAWPGDKPLHFAGAVLIGASAAVVLCHLLPAICEPAIERLSNSLPGQVLLFALALWLTLGAAASLFETAALTASMAVLWQDIPLVGADGGNWRLLAGCIAGVCVLASVVAASSQLWTGRVAWVCLGVGLGLAAAGVLVQSAALGSTNSQMQSERGLGDSASRVAVGMLLASAPAAILALRIGRMGLSFRKLASTGFWGVWLPLVSSVSLVSVAKMLGVRLYWKPSLPLDTTWAFMWMPHTTDERALFLWPLAATLAAPLLVLATWIVDPVRHWRWNWKKIAALMGIAAGGYSLKAPILWDSATRTWLWTIVAASLVFGVFQLWISVRHKHISGGD